jgi:hypothetical protein
MFKEVSKISTFPKVGTINGICTLNGRISPLKKQVTEIEGNTESQIRRPFAFSVSINDCTNGILAR